MQRLTQRPFEPVSWMCSSLVEVKLLEDRGLSSSEAEAVEVETKYAGFVRRQQAELSQVESQHRRRLPTDLDYSAISTLSHEAREKLAKVQYPP